MSISFVRWQPWQEMETVRRQLDQLFEEMTPIARHSLTQVNLNQRDRRIPLIELAGTENDLILKIELPGVEGKDLDIQVTREAVSIQTRIAEVVTPESTPDADSADSAEVVEAPQLHIYRSEFRSTGFHRVIPLPVEVDNDNVQADFKQGILTLTLPKRLRDRNHAVKVAL